MASLVVKAGDIEVFYTPAPPTKKNSLNNIVNSPGSGQTDATAAGQARPSPTPPPRNGTPAPATSTPAKPSSPSPSPVATKSPPPAASAATDNAAAPAVTGKWLPVIKEGPPCNLAEVKNTGLLLASISAPPGDYSQLKFRILGVSATLDGGPVVAEIPAEPIQVKVSFKVVKGKDSVLTLNLDGESSLTARESARPVFKPIFRILVAKPPLILQAASIPSDTAATQKSTYTPAPKPAAKPSLTPAPRSTPPATPR
jgi:hypothetical protein